jgi:gas vesicle protein
MRRFFNFFLGVVTGAVLGSTLALLLTPSSGNTIRDQINTTLTDIFSEIREAGAQRRIELQEELIRLRTPAPDETQID